MRKGCENLRSPDPGSRLLQDPVLCRPNRPLHGVSGQLENGLPVSGYRDGAEVMGTGESMESGEGEKEMKQLSPLKSIRKHCLWCANGSFEVIRECNAEGLCPLWPLRMGKRVIGTSPLKTVRAKCLECVDGFKAVKECTGDFLTGDSCPLHPFRFGRGNRVRSDLKKNRDRDDSLPPENAL